MDDNERKARLRLASERLYGNSSLRKGLNDQEAERLLAWGFAQVEREAERAQTLSAEEASEAVEAHVNAVENALRLVNQMVEQLPETTETRGRDYVVQLVDALCKVDARTVQINDMLALEELVARREALSRSEIFQQVLEVMDRPPEGEDDTEKVAAGEEEKVTSTTNRGEGQTPVAVPNAITDSVDTGPEEEE